MEVMAAAVANCSKCNKIFQKILSDLCPTCIQLEEEQFTLLYRALQKSAAHGGIAIETLSADLGIPVEDIERFYLEGRLSTAGIFLKFSCQGCGLVVGDMARKGRYCLKCSEMTATKAGVEVKSRQELEKEDAKEAARQKQLALLKKNQPTDNNTQRFGSTVRNR
jgi:hypothetical protein